MNLQLKVNNSFVDIMPDIQITVRRNFNFFNFDASKQGSYTIPINLPLTKINKKIFGFSYLLGVSVDSEYNADLLFFDYRIPGLLSVISFDDTTIECDMIIENGSFYNQIKDKKITDVDYGTKIFTDYADYLNYMNDAAKNSKYPDYTFACFPIKNANLYDNTGIAKIIGTEYINDIDKYGNLIDRSGFWSYVRYNYPFPYLGYIVRKIFETQGYNVLYNIFESDDDLKKIVILTNKEHSKKWFVNILYFGYLFLNYNNFLEPILINNFLNGLENLFGIHISFTGNNVSINSYKEIIIKRDQISDIGKMVLSIKKTKINRNSISLAFKYNSNDSMNTIDLEKITGEVAGYNLLPVFDNPYIHYGEIQFVKDENSYYIFGDYEDPVGSDNYKTTWFFYSYNLAKTGENKDEITTDIIPIPTRTEYNTINSNTFSWRIPYMNEAAYNMPKFGNGYYQDGITKNNTNIFPLRLCFNHGLQTWHSGFSTGFGSSDNYDVAGNKIGNMSLSFTGEDGIYNKMWSIPMIWNEQIREEYEVQLIAPYHFFNQIQSNKLYRIGANLFVFNSVETTLTKTGNSIIKAVLYKIA